MKLLLIGYFPQNPSIYAYASSFIKPLQQLGFEVKPFNYREKIIPYTNIKPLALLNKKLINRKLIATARAFKPDVVFCIKAETITPNTLANLKKHCSPTLINFYPDSPFALWNGNSTPDVLNSLPLYDHFLIWTHELTPALASAGCKNVSYFPFAFDKELFGQKLNFSGEVQEGTACIKNIIPRRSPLENPLEKMRVSSDVCFIGTWEPERERWLTALCEKITNLDLAIWGNEWRKHIASTSVLSTKIRGDAIYGTKMHQAFKQSKIVLNFIRQQNIQAHNMRTFEVPACNAFLLTQWTHDQANVLFKDGKSIVCFTTLDDLVQKITYYLAHDKDRVKIAQNGFICAQEFTLEKQLALFFESIYK